MALTLTTAFDDSAIAARKAREQAQLLESVFSSITDPIIVVDEAGRAVSLERGRRGAAWALAPASRRTSSAMPGSRTPACIAPTRSRCSRRDELPLSRALKGEAIEGVDAVSHATAAEPEGAWLKVSARPLLDDTGAVRGAVERQPRRHGRTARPRTAVDLGSHGFHRHDGRRASGTRSTTRCACVVANLEMAAADLGRLSATTTRPRARRTARRAPRGARRRATSAAHRRAI